MIGIIDIELGNNESVYKIFRKLNVSFCIIKEKQELTVDVKKIIFPGVGTFPEANKRLQSRGLKDAIVRFIEQNGDYLGICLGMQLLARRGFEVGVTDGLGIIDADVVKMKPSNDLSLPHIGWNNIAHDGEALFGDIDKEADFYFVHSFHMQLNENCKNFTVDYGGSQTAYVTKGKVHGVQFHPEKSQAAGQKLIENFLKC